MNYVHTVAWMLFAVVATYTAAEGTLAYKKTVEQDGAGAGSREDHPKAEPQQASDAAPPPEPIDVEAAYRAILKKHVERHAGELNRLDAAFERLERQMAILRELKADQDGRLELVRQP